MRSITSDSGIFNFFPQAPQENFRGIRAENRFLCAVHFLIRAQCILCSARLLRHCKRRGNRPEINGNIRKNRKE